MISADGAEGKLLGTLPVSCIGGPNVWKEATTAIKNVTGVRDVYLKFIGEGGSDLFNFDYWYFAA